MVFVTAVTLQVRLKRSVAFCETEQLGMGLHLQFSRHARGYYLWAFSRMSVDTILGRGNGDNTALDFGITREKGKSTDIYVCMWYIGVSNRGGNASTSKLV